MSQECHICQLQCIWTGLWTLQWTQSFNAPLENVWFFLLFVCSKWNLNILHSNKPLKIESKSLNFINGNIQQGCFRFSVRKLFGGQTWVTSAQKLLCTASSLCPQCIMGTGLCCVIRVLYILVSCTKPWVSEDDLVCQPLADLAGRRYHWLWSK